MNNSPALRTPFAIALGMLLLFAQTGCDKEKMDEMVAKAKETAGDLKEKGGDALKKAKDSASDAMSTAKDSASKLTTSAGNLVVMNGKAKIKLDTPTDFPASFVRILAMGDGSHVLQVKSYKDGQEDSYPAFLLQGVTDQASIDSLSGQSVSCQFYAQKSGEADVWKNVTGQPVVLQFQKTEDKLTATFDAASIVNSTNGSEAVASGSLECVSLE